MNSNTKDYKLYKEAWKHFIDCKNIDELDDDELKLLYSYDFIPFKEFPKPKQNSSNQSQRANRDDSGR